MKGVVFTEFLDHVEAVHGPVMLERVIDESGVETEGAYTSVGTYPCSQLGQLIGALSAKTGAEVHDIVRAFGEKLANSFHTDHPQHFAVEDFFDFVEAVDNRIHVDVMKLYPDAELPRFVTVSRTDEKLVIDYMSSRRLEHLAYGLFVGSARIYGETIAISMMERDEAGEHVIQFEVERV